MSTQLQDQSRSQSPRYPCPAGNEIAQRLAQFTSCAMKHAHKSHLPYFSRSKKRSRNHSLSKFLLWFQNQLAKIKRQEQYKTLTYKDDKLQQHIYRKT